MILRELLLKTKCINCKRVSPEGICRGCINQIQPLPAIFCPVCKSVRFKNSICLECEKRSPYFQSLSCLGVYNGLLKSLIYNYKYEKNKYFGKVLAGLLAEKIKEETDLKTINIVTSIPLHKEKLKSRGFNQAGFLAVNMAKRLNLPYKEILIRTRNTKPQFSLSAEERRENLKEAFYISKKITGKNILLVDDIFTTGTTVQEACRVMVSNSSGKIFVAVLGRSII